MFFLCELKKRILYCSSTILEASVPHSCSSVFSMDSNCFFNLFILIILASMFSHAQPTLATVARPPISSSVTVIGSVYCDVCYSNSFTRYSYFLPGVDVHIQCKFEANSPNTTEKIAFSVNRTTDRNGVYKLDIPSIDGVDCVDGPTFQSLCQATLIRSSSSSCNFPGLSSTTTEITVKSNQNNLCIYSISALNYRPLKKNLTLCGNHADQQQLSADSFNSSKTFFPFFPPYFFPWPQLPPLPQLPPWPQLPPLPPWPSLPPLPPLPQMPFFPFPPLPSLPPLPQLPPLPSFPPSVPIPQPPSLPFPFPPLPPFTPSPLLAPPTPPAPTLPYYPFFAPPPPSAPTLPYYPFFAPPSPAFNPTDPRTWIPYFPPSPPHNLQNEHP